MSSLTKWLLPFTVTILMSLLIKIRGFFLSLGFFFSIYISLFEVWNVALGLLILNPTIQISLATGIGVVYS